MWDLSSIGVPGLLWYMIFYGPTFCYFPLGKQNISYRWNAVSYVSHVFTSSALGTRRTLVNHLSTCQDTVPSRKAQARCLRTHLCRTDRATLYQTL